jgi:hypothetical protein
VERFASIRAATGGTIATLRRYDSLWMKRSADKFSELA